MLAEKKAREIVTETYRLLYKAAIPSADFDKLCEDCCRYVDDNGNVHETETPLTSEEVINRGWRKDIQFEKYYLNRDEYKKIVDAQAKKYRLKGAELNGFYMQAYLGCGPTSKETMK